MKIMTEDEMLNKLRRHILYEFKTQKEAAKHYGVSEAYISAVLCRRKPPSSALLKIIGLQKTSFFVEASNGNS